MINASRHREEQIVIPAGQDWLYGMIHLPQSGIPGSILICNSLFEERKSSHTTLVGAARAFCDRGFAVLRFDYRGCGDSSGDITGVTVSSWMEDIRAAAACLQAKSGAKIAAVLGLRIGCALALDALEGLDIRRFVMWEPVPGGRDYFAQELRKSLIREMMTSGSGTRTTETVLGEIENGRTIDFDGFPVTPALYRDISALTIPRRDSPPAPKDILVVNIAPRDEISAPLRALCAALGEHGAEVQSCVVKEQPFWNLVDMVDGSELIKTTADWISGRHD